MSISLLRWAGVAAIVLLAGCQPEPGSSVADRPMIEAVSGGQRSVPWTGLQPVDDPGTFRFVIVTDRTGQHRPGVFAEALRKVNLLAPAFVVSVGDLIEGYTEDQEALDREWDELEGLVGELEAPFFYTPGNHDLSNALMAETWQRRFGPSFYHFTYQNVLFLVLNSELFGMVGREDVPLPGPWTQGEQMAFVERVLAEQQDVRWTVVLLHQPLWDAEVIDDDWLQVEAWLGERDYTVFAGHHHRYSRQRRHGRNFITLATTGGGSRLRGPLFGELDQVALVTMTQDGPRIANLALDGLAGEDLSNPHVLAQAEALADSVTVQADIGEQPTFEAERQVAVLANPGEAELHVSPVLLQAGSFNLQGLEARTLAPGETAELALELAADGPTAYRDLRPAAVAWNLTTQIDGRAAEVQALTPILPLTVHDIPQAEPPPVVDGDLGDWGTLRFRVDGQGDVASPAVAPDDLSFHFDVRQDDDALYVAVEVMDDSLVFDPARVAREQDSIVVAVDTRDDAARNRSMEIGEAVLGGDLAQTAVQMLTPQPAAHDALLPFLADTAERTRSATVRVDGGYRTEIAFPHALLDEQAAGATWQTARIIVMVYDFDDGEAGSVALHWQPYRYGAAPLPGTHSFRRN